MEVVNSDSSAVSGEPGFLQRVFRWFKDMFGKLATKEFWASVLKELAQSAAVSILSAIGAVLGNTAKKFVMGNDSLFVGNSPVGQAGQAFSGTTSYPSSVTRSAAPAARPVAAAQGSGGFPGFG